MLLTPEQLAEISQIIRDHHSAFIAAVVGKDALTKDTQQRLAKKGMFGVEVSSIEDAYLYGQAMALLDDPKVASMSYEEFKRYVAKNPIPLSDIEQRAVQMAKQHAAKYIVGLGNKVDQSTGEILIEADADLRRQLQAEIRTVTQEGIARRKSVKQIKSDLGWIAKDWARDWDRIAITEKQMAMQQGVSDHYRKRYGPKVMVSKIPMPDACKHCKRLHLGPDGQPRIFPLEILEANGVSNYGRKTANWLPVVGAVHPHCQCQLIRVPAGWGYNEEGQLVPGGELGVRYESMEEMALSLIREDDLVKSITRGGAMEWNGLKLYIENAPGSKRHWEEPQTGAAGTTYMVYGYGYVKKTTGSDEDEIDVFVGPDPNSQAVFIVHQQNPKTGQYDEDKVMLGFANRAQAETAYQIHYDDPDYLWSVSEHTLDAFKRWIIGTNIDRGHMLKAGSGGEVFVIPEQLLKSKGPYIGPRGGKWADAAHTIPYKEGSGKGQPSSVVIDPSVPAHVAPKIAKVIQAVQKRVPELAGVKVEATDQMHESIHASKSNTMLRLNRSSWTEQGLDAYRKDWEGITVDADVEGVVMHELGHMLAGRVMGVVGADKVNEIHDRYISERDNPGSEEAPSVYGQENSSEFAAEAFVAYLTGKTATNPEWHDSALANSRGFWEAMLAAMREGRRGESPRLSKAGPFIGPRGGKWADPQHTIPYKEVGDKPKTYKAFVQTAVGALKRAGLKASKFPKRGPKVSGYKVARVPGFKLPGFQWEDWADEGDDVSAAKTAKAIEAMAAAGIEAKERVEGSGLYQLRWVGQPMAKATTAGSPAAHGSAYRHSPSPGTALNIQMEMLPKNQAETDPESLTPNPKDIYEPKEPEGVRIKRDPEQYMLDRAIAKLHEVGRTVEQDGMLQVTPEMVEDNQEWLRIMNQRRLEAATNHAQPEDDGARRDYYDGDDDE
jgi:hypothetical protein